MQQDDIPECQGIALPPGFDEPGILTSVRVAMPKTLRGLSHVLHLITDLVPKPKTLETATRNGYLHVLKAFHGQLRVPSDVMDHAAQGGHLETVKWLHENHDEGCTREVMAWGAQPVKVVEWLQQNRGECAP